MLFCHKSVVDFNRPTSLTLVNVNTHLAFLVDHVASGTRADKRPGCVLTAVLTGIYAGHRMANVKQHAFIYICK